MKIKYHQIIRIVLGVFCFIFGIHKFLYFLPMPTLEGDAKILMDIYINAGFLKLIGGFEILAGLALILNKYVPLALIILTAILFNAVIFHLLYDIKGVATAVIGLMLAIALINLYKPRFLSIMSP